ncbi:MAG: MBL fold metallo-hydrolase [Firmicutes bacterium]|nr:MBL fold metallo-hydrolase [Bacillota bacterium]
MLKIITLASGSSGNAIYVESSTTRILIDCGLSLPKLFKRFESAGINPDKIDAVLITHEHSDHVIGLGKFMERFSTKLYIHEDTTDIFAYIEPNKVRTFQGIFSIGDIEVGHFPVPHDSMFCFGYTFKKGDAKMALATDIGRITEEIIEHMSGSQVVMIESNHDLVRLQSNKRYPMFLKRRITSQYGHLSNPACAEAVYELFKTGTTQVILGHISRENNSPELACDCVRDFLTERGVTPDVDIAIAVALQDEVKHFGISH